MHRSLIVLIYLVSLLATFTTDTRAAEPSLAPRLVPHRISLTNGRSFDLNLPEGFAISVAAQGLKRVRFLANSPDNRIFVTDMYNLSDNKRGIVYILDDFDPAGKIFKTALPSDVSIAATAWFAYPPPHRAHLSPQTSSAGFFMVM